MRHLIGRIVAVVRGLDSILLFLATVVLLICGAGWARVAVEGRPSMALWLVGPFALLLAVSVLWLTVDRWAGWVYVVACIGVLKAVPVLLTGRLWTAPFSQVPRWQAALVVAYAVAVVLLTYRFSAARPRTDETMALIVFVVVGLVSEVLYRHGSISAVGRTVTLAMLLGVWVRRTLSSRRFRLRRRRPSVAVGRRRRSSEVDLPMNSMEPPE